MRTALHKTRWLRRAQRFIDALLPEHSDLYFHYTGTHEVSSRLQASVSKSVTAKV